ncbi:MAG: Smr/MutS family protein, partial [Bilophila sp.]
MSDEQPFAAENPFRKLDKKRFQSVGDKKDKKAVAAKALRKPVAVSLAGDEEDASTFLAAVSGAAPLGMPAKPVFRKHESMPPLDNPLLGTVKVARTPSEKTDPTSCAVAPTEELPDYGEVTPLSRRESTRKKSRDAVQRTSAPAAHPAPVAPVATEPDDDLAFFSALKGVTPLAGRGREVLPELPIPVPVFVEESPQQDFMDTKLEFALACTSDYMEGHVIGLDLMTVGKLQAGQCSPEAHLDLHGMNAQQAFQALVGFFRGAYLKGLRTLLVVPGRGLNSPQGVSILRDKLQDWLTQEPFR